MVSMKGDGWSSRKLAIGGGLSVYACVVLPMGYIDQHTWMWAVGLGVGGYLLGNMAEKFATAMAARKAS